MYVCSCTYVFLDSLEVPIWLKSLRLHKYQDLFQSMTYDEMLGISDEFLQQKVCL